MRSRPRVVRLRKPKIPDDSQFIETLVWVLDRARQGKIRAYAALFTVEREDGTSFSVETACVRPDEYAKDNALTLLGGVELMKAGLMKRVWEE